MKNEFKPTLDGCMDALRERTKQHVQTTELLEKLFKQFAESFQNFNSNGLYTLVLFGASDFEDLIDTLGEVRKHLGIDEVSK